MNQCLGKIESLFRMYVLPSRGDDRRFFTEISIAYGLVVTLNNLAYFFIFAKVFKDDYCNDSSERYNACHDKSNPNHHSTLHDAKQFGYRRSAAWMTVYLPATVAAYLLVFSCGLATYNYYRNKDRQQTLSEGTSLIQRPSLGR